MPLPEQRSPEWFEARQGKITASVAAACLGVGPNGPLWAYSQIKGAHQADNKHLAWGREFEAQARTDYEILSGHLVVETGFVTHPDRPWLGASPDGLVGEDGLVEIKCPSEPPAAIPPHHEIQMRIQLACCDRFWCDYYAWAGPRYFCRQIRRDMSIESDLLARLEAFYKAYVVPGKPPPRRRNGHEGT